MPVGRYRLANSIRDLYVHAQAAGARITCPDYADSGSMLGQIMADLNRESRERNRNGLDSDCFYKS